MLPASYQFVSGTPLLTVRGEIVNVASWPQKGAHAALCAARRARGEAYAWTLNGVGARQVGPGEATSFLTRVAAPPGISRKSRFALPRSD
jgi:hypothetical protein